jgi:hypothetical protein
MAITEYIIEQPDIRVASMPSSTGISTSMRISQMPPAAAFHSLKAIANYL